MTNKFATSVDQPQHWRCTVTTANTARDGTGSNHVKLLDGGKLGSRIDSIVFQAQGTIAADSMLRLFLSPDNGTTKYLRKEFSFTTLTPASGTAPAQSIEPTLTNPVVVNFGESVWISIHTSDTVQVHASGGDF